ncbi:MAG: hypothetical protein HYX90_03200 [Chloroflexi bacterium]|nr:hypothetical protein [Chloroflexota bacterium]
MLTATRRELEKRRQESEAETQIVEALKGEEGGVKRSITALRESAVKEIKDTATSAAAEVKQLCQGLRQNITTWGNVKAEIGKYQEELKLARYFTVLPLSEQALSSLVEDIGLPVVMQYLVIALSWCRKKLNPKLKPSKAILRKYYSISEYTEVELTDVITWALLMLVEGMENDQERA